MLGRLVLTSERLLFLSTGSHDITAWRVLGTVVSQSPTNLALPATLATPDALDTAETSHLDTSATEAAGGLDVPHSRLRSAKLHRIFTAMTVSWDDGHGHEVFSTFAAKNIGMPDGRLWVKELERCRLEARQ
jgi:hypothetical protein